MSLGLIYKNHNKIFDEVLEGTPFLEYPLLKGSGFIKHGFSTRLGGHSKGYLYSLNLGFSNEDDYNTVLNNYKSIGNSIGISIEDMVLSAQTHTSNIVVVNESHKGNGITKPQKMKDVDGLVTNVKNVCLVTSYADCVPLYFVDPINKAIGLSHSGWRGTVKRIGQKTIGIMKDKYGTNSEDLLVGIGPSICIDCYEVSQDVVDKFHDIFDNKDLDEIYHKKENDKYQLDLWKANELILLEAGVKADNIAVTNLCTKCNSDILYSHREAGDKRGNLCAFLMIK